MSDKYTNRTGVNVRREAGPLLDPERPSPGCYRVVLRRGAPDSALKIWLGRPTDCDALERPFLWQAELNGAPVDVWHYWPACARQPISQDKHDSIVGRNATMDASSPFYDPRRPIDLRTAPLPF